MSPDDGRLYRALTSRDPRFDGVFFVGVTSTRIYCRPICTAKTPKRANCRFFPSTHLAEQAGFRPCLRCRPELAPGLAPVDGAQRTALLFAQRVEEGRISANTGLDAIAKQFGLSTRQIRRIILKELGVSPIAFLQTRRLLMAKQLLTETALPMSAIAYASGFASLRRFNDAFNTRYRMSPTRLRKAAVGSDPQLVLTDTSTVRLSYRAPYDWEGMLAFLRARALRNTEVVTEDTYFRTVRLGKHVGWIAVRHEPEKRALLIEFTHSLLPVLGALLGRLRNLFDLDARPDMIATHLGLDQRLRAAVTANPGLRVPGALDSFELAARAILGQQITVKAATAQAYRLVEAFGESVATPIPELSRLFPRPDKIARASTDDLGKLGIISTRAASLIALARAYVAGTLRLESGGDPDGTVTQLLTIPGIGPWTAQYIAMRALRWPDAFPKEDVQVRKKLGGISAKAAESLAHAWRPWRSYAVLYLWRTPPAITQAPR